VATVVDQTFVNGMLKPGLGIYVTTAANPTESSWHGGHSEHALDHRCIPSSSCSSSVRLYGHST
jgi:hypothetical protein